MKKLLLLSFLSFLSMNLHANIFLNSWNVKDYPQVSNGQTVNIIYPKGTAKDITIQFNVTRDFDTDYIFFQINIEHTSLNGTKTIIHGESYVGYNWENSYSIKPSFNFTIPADKSEGNLSIILVNKSSIGNPPKNTTAGGSYSLNYTAPPVIPVDPASFYVDGKFYHNTGDGKVYVCMEGKYRHIESTNTLYGVFKTNPELNPISASTFNSYFTSRVGAPVGPSARIVMDNYTSKIYYQENGILRYITSRTAAERWSLDIEKRQYMNGTGSLTFGPNI